MKQKVEVSEVSGISIIIHRKPVRNLYLKIDPTTREVVISAPRRFSTQQIHNFVLSKRGWIEKHQERLKNRKTRPPLAFTDGETLLAEGRSYILRIDESDHSRGISIDEPYLIMSTKKGDSREKRGDILAAWYRKALIERVGLLIGKWEPIIGVKVNEWHIKKMKTKWGSCNTRDRRIWISLELAKLDQRQVEYIVVHEMIHLLERGHNKRFYSLLDYHLPGWKGLRKELKEYSVGG